MNKLWIRKGFIKQYLYFELVKDQLQEDRVSLLKYFDVFKANTEDIISTLTKEVSE